MFPHYYFTLFDLFIQLHLMPPVDTSRKIVLNKESFYTLLLV